MRFTRLVRFRVDLSGAQTTQCDTPFHNNTSISSTQSLLKGTSTDVIRQGSSSPLHKPPQRFRIPVFVGNCQLSRACELSWGIGWMQRGQNAVATTFPTQLPNETTSQHAPTAVPWKRSKSRPVVLQRCKLLGQSLAGAIW